MVEQTATDLCDLKAIREGLAIVQMRLAVLAGVSSATIVAIEKHGHMPTERTRQKIAKALGVLEADIWPHLLDTPRAHARTVDASC